MSALTPGHLLILVIVVVALFGAKKLPDVARGLGQSARIFKAEMRGLEEDSRGRNAVPQASGAPEPEPEPGPGSTEHDERRGRG